MVELDWIRKAAWTQEDRDYIRLVYKKTAWYTFIAPVIAGGIIAGVSDGEVAQLARITIPLGIAFQIQDDILNLVSDSNSYGKDYNGDLWEGKHTLILIHALRCANPLEKARALEILRRPQPSQMPGDDNSGDNVGATIMDLAEQGDISPRARDRLLNLNCAGEAPAQLPARCTEDIVFLRELVDTHQSVAYAWEVAQRHARKFQRELKHVIKNWPASVHRDFLEQLAEYIIHRTT